tara:strand:+ start:388 stop:1191 length:804 start_codon:yes stop_codon:yes gene_type:complete
MLHDLFKKRAKSNNDFVNDYRINKLVELILEKQSKLNSDKKDDEDDEDDEDDGDDNDHQLNLLEIGCGTGAFLIKLLARLKADKITGVNLCGIDIDQNALDSCTEPEITLMNNNAETFDHGRQYDFVINFELIEHLIDPTTFIQNIKNNLTDGGYFVMTTPNSLGLETKAIGYNSTRLIAHAIFPPMHLNAFNPRNIYYFLIKNGFKAHTVSTPGCLDVSICLNTIDEVDPIIKPIADLDEKAQEMIQTVTTYLDGSSHMFCVGQKI